MSSITQIMYFKISNDRASEPNQSISELATRASTMCGETEGLTEVYIGHETEDPSNAFWVFEWASKSAHDTHLHSDTLKVAREVVRPLFASKPSHTIVEFPNTKGIFSAPVTEFVTFTLKEGVTMDKLEPFVNQLQNGLIGTQKFYGSSWAPVIDKPNVYYGVLGWESVQAHWDAVSSGPLKEIIDQVKGIADLWLVHAKLTPHNA
ncbi:hypothetical protein M405DRAFT_823631 [Rhizopogon salebrosus TDB-379]|nr:hypothetical protein M405DRAFT_823631 [Rhizopogon salebrosus TDB-379]